jgi:hypothetical protein
VDQVTLEGELQEIASVRYVHGLLIIPLKSGRFALLNRGLRVVEICDVWPSQEEFAQLCAAARLVAEEVRGAFLRESIGAPVGRPAGVRGTDSKIDDFM